MALMDGLLAACPILDIEMYCDVDYWANKMLACLYKAIVTTGIQLVLDFASTAIRPHYNHSIVTTRPLYCTRP